MTKDTPPLPDNYRICLYSKECPEGKIFTADAANDLNPKVWFDNPKPEPKPKAKKD